MNKTTDEIYTAINAGMFEVYGFCEDDDYTITNKTENSFVINYKDGTGSIKITVNSV